MLMPVPLPPGRRFELLSPFAPEALGGRGAPRKYPFHLMGVGDYFAIDFCTPQQSNSIRTCLQNFKRTNPTHQHWRFRVVSCPEAGKFATTVCVRVL